MEDTPNKFLSQDLHRTIGFSLWLMFLINSYYVSIITAQVNMFTHTYGYNYNVYNILLLVYHILFYLI